MVTWPLGGLGNCYGTSVQFLNNMVTKMELFHLLNSEILSTKKKGICSWFSGLFSPKNSGK